MSDLPVSYLNSNDGSSILAFGEGPNISCDANCTLSELQSFLDSNNDQYIFLALSYDLKNSIEDLKSNNIDNVEFPKFIAWVPKYVVEIKGNDIRYLKGVEDEMSSDFLRLFRVEKNNSAKNSFPKVYNTRTSKTQYINNVRLLQEELQKGNIYEVNYCQEFYWTNCELPNPISTYFKLNKLTKAPYSAYFNFGEHVLMCGSPERFIHRKGDKLISSPIKGTKKRGGNEFEDEQLRTDLLNDTKERSENVMIVDLVRNDLSRVAQKNSVKVDELFGIYTFETVHQMISTISCQVRQEMSFVDILKATFPMGSMTGAPKISAMNLIEQYEDFRRGIYSGSVGYIKPNGDFDFNVVIRSLVYNKSKKYLSCAVGGAITIKSDPENEYEECQIKVEAILKGMNG